MAESVSYWICSCGKSNLKSSRRCTACEKRRPRRWILYSSLAVVGVVAIAVFTPTPPTPTESQSGLSDAQTEFLSRIEAAQESAITAPNSLAFNDLLDLRDNQLAELSSVERWSGTILGIQRMQGKGAVSIDIGGVTVLAGVHLSLGLDTLIPPSQSDVYTELLSLQRGDDVIFSGRFLVHSGSLVEMSYTGSGAISAPEFLFEFSELSRRPTPEHSEN